MQDEPSDEVVSVLAHSFEHSGGDLQTLAGAVVDLEQAWMQADRKLRPPEDWLTAVGRAVELDTVSTRSGRKERTEEALVAALVGLGQLPFSAPSPAGWPDRAVDLAGSEALLDRIDLAERGAAVPRCSCRLCPTHATERRTSSATGSATALPLPWPALLIGRRPSPSCSPAPS